MEKVERVAVKSLCSSSTQTSINAACICMALVWHIITKFKAAIDALFHTFQGQF